MDSDHRLTGSTTKAECNTLCIIVIMQVLFFSNIILSVLTEGWIQNTNSVVGKLFSLEEWNLEIQLIGSTHFSFQAFYHCIYLYTQLPFTKHSICSMEIVH